MPRSAPPDPVAAPSAPHLEFAEAERLVGLGFRLWLTGYKTGDISCWERAWQAYSNSLGPQTAKGVVTDLACWVKAINRHACRELETASVECDRFCRDECVAIAMIAACQHNACPAMRACAFSLLGCSMIDEVVRGAETFAATMRDVEQVLRPSFAERATLMAMPAATPALQ